MNETEQKKKEKKPIYKRVWFWIVVGVIVLFIAVPTDESSEPNQAQGDTSGKTVQTDTPQKEETSDKATTGQKNALRAAKSYLSYTPFSYAGLIHQLEFEKYSTEDATYAADNCGADWNEQALAKAKDYLYMSAFSKKGLAHQLEFEGFTEEEAAYGVDNCGADWNEQAAKQAKDYLDMSAFSKDELINQLEFEGFTHEEAVYGAEQNGY